jgi:outer membrane protein OmpA-like peptidoglycan-associated protein
MRELPAIGAPSQRYHEGVKRITFISIGAILFAGLLTIDYKGYQSLKAMKSQIIALTAQVQQATELAQRESAATLAASHRAEEAAAQAEIASGARKQAEQQRDQAEVGRAQAENAAQQASSQAQRANQEAQQARDEVAQMRLEREKELNRMQEALNSVVETHRTPNGMVMVLPDSIFRFNFDSSDLNQKNRELLSRIAGILLVSKGYGLSVYGYTDDVGTAEYNQQLSVRRAKAVEDYLVQSGIDRSIINVKGYGKTNPLVPSTSASARAKNRRVEIALTDSSIRFIGEAPGTTH